MSTFTAQELADFYQQVADGGEIELNGGYGIGYVTNLAGPDMLSQSLVWRIKPKKKVVDMSALIKSGIDCEFSTSNGCLAFKGPLVNISHASDGTVFYEIEVDGRGWLRCRPRMNHVHAWQGGDCPLPEGVTVQIYKRTRDVLTREPTGDASSFDWHHYGTYGDIIAFEVLGLAEGWQWPWEG